MPKRSHFDFLKFSSTNKPSASLGKLCFVKNLLGISSLTKIITPPPLRFLSSLYGKEKPSIWNWELGNVSSSLVSHTTKLSTCFKINCFSWSNIDEMKFMFISPIIVLLTFFNLNFSPLTGDLNLVYFEVGVRILRTAVRTTFINTSILVF